MSVQYPQCRYVRRNEERCTAEVADSSEDAEILLCTKHIARAMELVKRQAAARRLIKAIGAGR